MIDTRNNRALGEVGYNEVPKERGKQRDYLGLGLVLQACNRLVILACIASKVHLLETARCVLLIH